MENKHSGIGIASFVTSVVAGVFLLATIGIAGVLAVSTPGGINPRSITVVILGLSIIVLASLDLVALGLGIAALSLEKNRKKVFAILGTVLSLGMTGITICLMIVGNLRSAHGSRQVDRLVVNVDPLDRSRFFCDVTYATFRTPKGWSPNRSGGNTYAILSRVGESYPFTQMISIDIGKPVAPTTEATANAFAKKWNGQVAPISSKIDGETAFRVNIPPDHKTVRPIDCIIAIRDGRLFMLIGGARKNLGR